MLLDLAYTALITGIAGTIAMDLSNYAFSRVGLILKIDVAMIGRMAAGWAKGRFSYGNPSELKSVTHETLLGYLAHYVIGISLAVVYLAAWELSVDGPPSPYWATLYGFVTTAVSEFYVYPSMGLGVCGRRSPERLKAGLSPVVNHLFFGLGMGVAVACL